MAFAAFVSVINEQTLGTADAEVVRLDDLMTTLSKLRSTAHRDDSDADSGYVEQTPANDVLDTAMARIQELIDERRSNLGVVAPQVESAAEERHLHELATV